MALRVVTRRQDFINKHSPTIMAGCIASKDNWWRIGEAGHQELARVAIELTIALCDEIDRAVDAEDDEIRAQAVEWRRLSWDARR